VHINAYLFNLRKLCHMKAAFHFKKVMIIDDDDLSRLLAEKLIKKFDFADEVVECATAIEGLNYLNTNSFALPEIIFLDINMPVLNGFEFLDKFEKLNNTVKEHCAIIMLSSSVDTDDIKRAEADKHVRFFLSKPLTLANLKAISNTFSTVCSCHFSVVINS
jgi:CheY-like chemotaxis protein